MRENIKSWTILGHARLPHQLAVHGIRVRADDGCGHQRRGLLRYSVMLLAHGNLPCEQFAIEKGDVYS